MDMTNAGRYGVEPACGAILNKRSSSDLRHWIRLTSEPSYMVGLCSEIAHAFPVFFERQKYYEQ